MVVSRHGGRHTFRSVVAAPGRELAVASAAALGEDVVAVVPDVPVAGDGWPSDGAPDDPSYAPYQGDLPQTGVPAAWATTTGSPTTVVAVLDTGAWLGHPDFAGLAVAGTWSEVTTLADGVTPNPAWHTTNVTDVKGHGTHVLGTIAAGANDGVGIAGIAPGVSVLVVKVLGDNGAGWSTWINAGIEWAIDHGADVINLSLGGIAPIGSLSSTVYDAAIADAVAAGVTVVASAGNSGDASYNWPASAPGVISVASVGMASIRSAFSTRNDRVDIAAPGEGILSAQPAALGTWAHYSGTSMAAPHVSAVAALVASAAPGISPSALSAILTSSALDLGSPGRDDDTGWGLVRADAAVALAVGDPLLPPDAAPSPAPSEAPSPSPSVPPAGDVTPPQVTRLDLPAVVISAGRTITAAWAATDDTAVTGYEVRSRLGSAAWGPTATTIGTSRMLGPLAAGTWTVAVRARDAAGGWSAWRTALVVAPRDDRAYAFSAGTRRLASGGAMGGTLTSTTTPGARLVVRFTGRSIVLIGRLGPNLGRLRITVDGVSTVVDTGRRAGVNVTRVYERQVLLARTLAAGAHTVTITCLGTAGRPSIVIDAIGWRS